MRRGLTLFQATILAACGLALAVCVFLPVFTRAVQTARKPSCQGNLKQLATGAHMYASDYDDEFPPAAGWREAVAPYTKNEQLWDCQQDLRPSNPRVGSYSLNRYVGSVNVSRVLAADKVVLQFDADVTVRNSVSAGEDFAPRHGGGGTVSYLDGHVRKQVPAAQLRVLPPKLEPLSPRRHSQR